MTKTPLYAMLEALVAYLNAFRVNENDQPGKAVGEEKGATFGKVTGIEEVIARHAANVTLLRGQSDRLFGSDVIDDRNPSDSSFVSSGSIVTITSEDYGQETYGLDVQVENGQRISSVSPMAKALLGRKNGDAFEISGTKYSIIKIHTQEKDEIMRRLNVVKNQIIDDTEQILMLPESNSTIGKSEEELRKKLKVSNLLDQISFVGLVEKTYGIGAEFSNLLREQKDILNKEPHFPVVDLEETTGYLHIQEKLRNK